MVLQACTPAEDSIQACLGSASALHWTSASSTACAGRGFGWDTDPPFLFLTHPGWL